MKIRELKIILDILKKRSVEVQRPLLLKLSHPLKSACSLIHGNGIHLLSCRYVFYLIMSSSEPSGRGHLLGVVYPHSDLY